jgi:hypothetical protein
LVAIDLSIELSGRIESGGDFGIGLGGLEIISEYDEEIVEDETWLAANDA